MSISTIFTFSYVDVVGHLVVCMNREHKVDVLSIGMATVANKKTLFVMLVDCLPLFEAH